MRKLNNITKTALSTIAVSVGFLFIAATTLAQDDAADSPNATSTAAVAPQDAQEVVADSQSDTAAEASFANDNTKSELQTSESTSDAPSSTEIEALKQQMADMKAEYDARLEQLEFKDLADLSESDLETGSRFFGFFDVAFMHKRFSDDAFFGEGDGFVNTSPQFLMQHLNLYFDSKLTSTLSFLAEMQFSFLPNGGMTNDFRDTERQSTVIVDPYTQQQFRWGGVMLQRAWLKWEPFQFLGVKVGYFLSPYGIWHEDHASTVRLSILPPFENDTITPPAVLGKTPMPKNQLGLQIFGRVFPADTLRLDYAFTVSNGRGSADTVVDYDDNKGLGLRLKLTYSGPKLEIALGGYGYYGEYSDKIFAYWNEELLENYKEYSVAADFLVAFYGVRLQAEYLGSTTQFNDSARPISVWGNSENWVTPNYDTSLFYALLAYELPLSKILGSHTFTPYVGYEYDRPRDELKGYEINIVNFGLNYKPSSVVCLKAEASRFDLTFINDMKATVWTTATQLAVSF
ncbi:MAG: hypothetical protein JXX14_17295 [Deltaproteobacteria bacterium]|nr:hypothetical protein [Deltaproteobacteria bacterium]